MEKNINLPYDELVQECSIINPENPKVVIDAIVSLADKYGNDKLVLIYNYFFECANNYEVLIFLLKKIDKLRDKSSLPVLIDSLLMKDKLSSRIKDNENITRLRVKIAKVLANTKDTQAVYPLLYCLNSKEENYKVKLSCAEALGKIGDRYAVLPLIHIVEDDTEQSVYVKESAVSALGMIGDDKAIDSLVSILESKKGFISKFTFLKERALEALNKLSFKSERVFRAVEKSLRDESAQVRINAIEVLMNSTNPKSGELIKKMLYDTNFEVVKNAVIALYNMYDNRILAEIISNSTMPDMAKTAAINVKEELLESDEEDTND